MLKKLSWKSAVALGAFSFMACKGVCGDGVLDNPNDAGIAEVCDDGNAAPGDGCNATCSLVENGFECPTVGQACVAVNNCGNGVIDAGEECDGADLNGLTDCTDLNASGALSCNPNTCALDTSACVAVAGDGIRTSDLIIFGQGEECDDGNLTNGDGCSANMTLEALSSYVQVDANNEMNGTDPGDAVFSVFGTIGGVDFDGDGITDGGFDFDGDGVAETSLLVVFSTDESDICDQIFAAGGFNDFLQNVLFATGPNGTVVLTMAQIPGDQAFAAGDITNANACTPTDFFGDNTAGTTAVDIGYTFQTTSDTTFGSDCTGTFAVDAFDFDDATLAGNLSMTSVNTVQRTQFLPAQAVINVPITATIKAAACNFDILQ